MPLELAGVVIGGGIGLLGGLGGVTLGHLLAGRRESRSRKIDGLREVISELEKRRRLALDIAQHINIGLRDKSPDELASQIFSVPGWKEVTLATHERTWIFPCAAYLPEAVDDFRGLDRQIAVFMDPSCYKPTDTSRPSNDAAIDEFNRLASKVQSKVEARLAKLLK